MTRRAGISLTEVLVALFIMAIGVIGVLTMFPVGAVQMGQALKDQRCAEATTQADAYLRWYWRHEIVEKPANSEPLWSSLNSPSAKYEDIPSDQLTKPSPPVFVDPMGAVAGAGATVTGAPNIQRVSLKLITDPPSDNRTFSLRTCTLLDGFTYDDNGTPTAEREDRYNWLWTVQRPSNAQKFRANMNVVVFNQRVHLFLPPNSEQSKTATFTDNSTTVMLGGAITGLQKGGWLMDASTTSNNVQLCDFYRVVSVTNDTAVELQTPIKPALGGGSRTTGKVVFLAGVAEVFERPPLDIDTTKAP